MGEAQFLHKEPCPQCGSKDNLARYDDGHAHCFSEGCDYYESATDQAPQRQQSNRKNRALIEGEVQPLKKRGITQATCEHWKYQTGRHKGKPVQIANYIQDGKVAAQKVRYPDKGFVVLGDKDALGLYGQWLWPKGGKMVVVTEGEVDALTVSQLQDNKWPVVSIPNGAQSAAKTFRSELEWLESFDKVVIMFDQDEAGQSAAQKAAAILSPGKAYIAKLPGKDPNALLQDGKGKDVIQAMWRAEKWSPDGIVSGIDLVEQATKPIEWGIPWPWEELTLATYGIRRKEIYAFGAGTGVGKTDLMTQVVAHLATVHHMPVGLLFLEQPPVETLRRVAGKVAGKRFHVPDADWTQSELTEAIERVGPMLTLFDHFGSTDWDSIKGRIRYMVQSMGIQDIFLDHLTALAAHAEDERKELEAIMADLATMAHELDITIYFVSHLSTPEGKPHEEGGRVFIRHFKGSRAIGFWSHFIFGLERDQQVDDESARHTSTFRILKDRYTGQATGLTWKLKYDQDTGWLGIQDEPDPFDDNDDEEIEF